MPHFAVDESVHGHRKIVRAGNAAVGLWVRLGSYACDQLSDGLIPAEIATAYGTQPQLRKLLAVGLLHEAGHACPRCAQPEAGDYVLHDYLVPNASRATVQRRQATAAAKKRAQRNGSDSPSNRDAIEGDPAANRDGIDRDSASNRPPVSDETAGHGYSSLKDEMLPRARPRPSPTPSPSTSYGGTTPLPPAEPERLPALPAAGDAAGERGQELRQLAQAMTAQGMSVAWTLRAEECQQLRRQVQRVGIHALVEHAARAWRNAKNSPYSARYFLTGWLALEPAPDGPPTGLYALGGPSKTTDYLADMAAIAEELRQKGTGS